MANIFSTTSTTTPADRTLNPNDPNYPNPPFPDPSDKPFPDKADWLKDHPGNDATDYEVARKDATRKVQDVNKSKQRFSSQIEIMHGNLEPKDVQTAIEKALADLHVVGAGVTVAKG